MYCLADDETGVYLTGGFSNSPIVFGSITLPLTTSDPFYIVKYDNNGNVICASSLASGGDDNNGVATDVFGNTYIVGDFMPFHPIIIGADTLSTINGETFFIAKYNCNGTTVNTTELPTQSRITLYPNPANNNLTIAFGKNTKKVVVTITDITGKLIYTTTASETEKMEVNANGFAEGVYIVKIQTGEGLEVKKLIIER